MTDTDISFTINPSFLLENDPARAYAIAALAAAQNDVAVVKAFIDAGLDAANAQHKSQTRGGPSFHHCVWLAAVQNDATDTLAVIVEKLSTKERTRLMSAKPQGYSSWPTALRFGAKKAIAFFLENNLGLRPNEELSAPFHASLLFNAALLGHENAVERLAPKADAKISVYTASYEGDAAGLAHGLAAGDCAASLRRLHARDSDALAATTKCFPLVLMQAAPDDENEDAESQASLTIRLFHPHQLRGKTSMPSCGHDAQSDATVFDPLDWALLAQAKNSVLFLQEALGAAVVSARAEGWAKYGKTSPSLAELRSRWHNQRNSQGTLDAQQKFIAFCEAVSIGASLAAFNASAATEAPMTATPARRSVRL